jgi:uncharacterized membrane protein
MARVDRKNSPRIGSRLDRSESSIPIGWSDNPSRWTARLLTATVSFIGFGVAFYLSLYEIGFIRNVWEPFFGNGVYVVLDSPLTRKLPIPDAVLGALGYLLETVLILAGNSNRWHDQPWLVTSYGLVAICLGMVSLLLLVYQTVLLRVWCTLCIISAIISTGLMVPALNELFACCQFLKRSAVQGNSAWRAFWGLDLETVQALEKRME